MPAEAALITPDWPVYECVFRVCVCHLRDFMDKKHQPTPIKLRGERGAHLDYLCPPPRGETSPVLPLSPTEPGWKSRLALLSHFYGGLM